MWYVDIDDQVLNPFAYWPKLNHSLQYVWVGPFLRASNSSIFLTRVINPGLFFPLLLVSIAVYFSSLKGNTDCLHVSCRHIIFGFFFFKRTSSSSLLLERWLILRLENFIFSFISLFLWLGKTNLFFLLFNTLRPISLTVFYNIFLCNLVTTIFVNGVSLRLNFLKERIFYLCIKTYVKMS